MFHVCSCCQRIDCPLFRSAEESDREETILMSAFLRLRRLLISWSYKLGF